jgi:cardiolipin synthase
LTIPNFITIARLVAVPLIVWLMIEDLYLMAALVFAIAGLSDAIDGFIAKKFGQESTLGGYLDPIADKALLVSVFVTLGFKGVLPLWLIVLAVSRDILIVGAVILSWMMEKPVMMRPLWISKLNTAMQIVLVAVALGEQAGVVMFGKIIPAGIAVVAATTVLSAAGYVAHWIKHMSDNDSEPDNRETPS